MITEGHLTRHYQGRQGGRVPAVIDIAQDHALALLRDAGVFELGAVLKGGTALRKFRAGNAGRFSTDLDQDDLRIARCNLSDRRYVQQRVASFAQA